MSDQSPNYDTQYHERYLFYKQKFATMKRGVEKKQREVGELRSSGEKKSVGLAQGSLVKNGCLRGSLSPQSDLVSSSMSGRECGQERSTAIGKQRASELPKLPIEAPKMPRNSPSPKPAAHNKLMQSLLRAKKEKEANGFNSSREVQLGQIMSQMPNGKQEVQPVDIPLQLAFPNSLPLHKNRETITAIENQLKEQKNQKQELLASIYEVQQEKNKIIQELKQKEEQQELKIANLAKEKLELEMRISQLENELKSEQEERIFCETEFKVKLEKFEIENGEKDKLVQSLTEKLKKAENEKESMTEIIRNFIVKKSEGKDTKTKKVEAKRP